MDYDRDKVDEMTLALMYLVMTRQGEGGKAWKGMDLVTLDRLHRKGWISDPRGRTPSVDVTPEGRNKAENPLRTHFQDG